MTPKTFHFARGPECEPPVDHPQGGKESRFIEGPVIVDPPPDGCVVHSGKVIKALVAASMQVPTSDFLPNRFRRLVADRRAETHEESAPLVPRPPGPKRVAQKVKRCCGVLPSPTAVLAVDNLRLLPVQLKPAFHKATCQSALEMVCLPLTATMADESSRPGESHPEALSEPCLNLSAHTAPPMQPACEAYANVRTGKGLGQCIHQPSVWLAADAYASVSAFAWPTGQASCRSASEMD